MEEQVFEIQNTLKARLREDQARTLRENRLRSEADSDRFREFLRCLPEGGLGFHGTTTKFKKSIDAHGLEPQVGKDPFIFYRVFDPINMSSQVEPQPSHHFNDLSERISGGLAIGANRTSKTSVGVLEETQPLLVVFWDPEKKGTIWSISRQTMIIEKVPRNNILGLYATSLGESTIDFIKRIRKDIIRKIIHRGARS